MTSSIETKLTLRLIRRLERRQTKAHNAFTLVELLVVVAIVGILSAIALPNFLAQTNKAKATEAKTHLASTLKQAHAKYLEDGTTPATAIATMTSDYGTPANGTTKFNYATTTPTFSDPVYTVMATGNSNDSGIEDLEIQGCVNFDTGVVDIGSNLAEEAEAVSCT